LNKNDLNSINGLCETWCKTVRSLLVVLGCWFGNHNQTFSYGKMKTILFVH